jgi:ubiquinone biosynthesis protein
VRTLARLPDVIRRLEAMVPMEGGAPPAPPVALIPAEAGGTSGLWRYAGIAVIAAAIGAVLARLF